MTRKISSAQQTQLLGTLRDRFEKHANRHPVLDWARVEARLLDQREMLWPLFEMERTGGEPDVAGVDERTGGFVFFDFSPETPKGRTGLCYDRAALDSRKEHKPPGNALDAAAEMGVEILSEEEYRRLQESGEFDLKTSSWLRTPAEVRERGGALFGDRRYGRVFIYHNGAASYFSARGFRASVRI